jgi:hypothetical protein
VYWSVDPDGRVFRTHNGLGEGSRPHVIVDDDGVEWSVRELATPQEWARGAHCLVLSSRDCVRRVWNYPDDWRRLGAEALFDLDVTLCEQQVETPRVLEP